MATHKIMLSENSIFERLNVKIDVPYKSPQLVKLLKSRVYMPDTINKTEKSNILEAKLI